MSEGKTDRRENLSRRASPFKSLASNSLATPTTPQLRLSLMRGEYDVETTDLHVVFMIEQLVQEQTHSARPPTSRHFYSTATVHRARFFVLEPQNDEKRLRSLQDAYIGVLFCR
jgi:hypothetical protein